MRVLNPSPLDDFLCKSFFQGMANLSSLVELVFSLVWRSKVPRKVHFFTWKVYDRINTLDGLSKMSLLVGPLCCIMCGRRRKTLAL